MQARAITRFQEAYIHHVETQMTASKQPFEAAHDFAIRVAHDRAVKASRESESVEA
jgi:hypothetical protein